MSIRVMGDVESGLVLEGTMPQHLGGRTQRMVLSAGDSKGLVDALAKQIAGMMSVPQVVPLEQSESFGVQQRSERLSKPNITGIKAELQQNDVIQINAGHEWAGCFAIVETVKYWGCIAYVEVPRKKDQDNGQAYIRLKTEEFISLGVKAPLVVA